MLISFSGMDGSGKSTQIERLRSDLSNAGRSVRCLAFWDNVVAFRHLRAGFSHKFLHSDGQVGSPERPANRNDKNARKWYLTILRSILYLCDAVRLRRAVSDAMKGDDDVLIFDRFIYDQLATLPLDNVLGREYVRLILKIVPSPDVALLLDAEPEAARARKPEYPVDFLHQYRASYLQLSDLAGLTVIAPMALESVHEAIVDAVANRGPAPIHRLIESKEPLKTPAEFPVNVGMEHAD